MYGQCSAKSAAPDVEGCELAERSLIAARHSGLTVYHISWSSLLCSSVHRCRDDEPAHAKSRRATMGLAGKDACTYLARRRKPWHDLVAGRLAYVLRLVLLDGKRRRPWRTACFEFGVDDRRELFTGSGTCALGVSSS